jgi:hypothetical protein
MKAVMATTMGLPCSAKRTSAKWLSLGLRPDPTQEDHRQKRISDGGDANPREFALYGSVDRDENCRDNGDQESEQADQQSEKASNFTVNDPDIVKIFQRPNREIRRSRRPTGEEQYASAGGIAHPRYSTVTLLAKLRGWSTSVPLATAAW